MNVEVLHVILIEPALVLFLHALELYQRPGTL